MMGDRKLLSRHHRNKVYVNTFDDFQCLPCEHGSLDRDTDGFVKLVREIFDGNSKHWYLYVTEHVDDCSNSN